jgi:hypothetical protein
MTALAMAALAPYAACPHLEQFFDCAKFKGFAYPTAPQTLVDTNFPDCQCAHIDYSATRSHQQYHLILVQVGSARSKTESR